MGDTQLHFVGPEAMNAAELACLHTGVTDREFRFGFLAGPEPPDIRVVTGTDLYSLDIMFFFHRVGHGTNFHEDSLCGLPDDRHMLLLTLISSFFLQEHHRLTAAHQITAGRTDNHHHVSTGIARVDLEEFCYRFPFII